MESPTAPLIDLTLKGKTQGHLDSEALHLVLYKGA